MPAKKLRASNQEIEDASDVRPMWWSEEVDCRGDEIGV